MLIENIDVRGGGLMCLRLFSWFSFKEYFCYYFILILSFFWRVWLFIVLSVFVGCSRFEGMGGVRGRYGCVYMLAWRVFVRFGLR